MKLLFRWIAGLYTLAFCVSAAWAWITYLGGIHSDKEQLLPGILLSIVCLPSSLAMERLAIWFPQLLEGQLPSLGIVTVLGIIQTAGVIFLVTRLSQAKSVDQT